MIAKNEGCEALIVSSEAVGCELRNAVDGYYYLDSGPTGLEAMMSC